MQWVDLGQNPKILPHKNAECWKHKKRENIKISERKSIFQCILQKLKQCSRESKVLKLKLNVRTRGCKDPWRPNPRKLTLCWINLLPWCQLREYLNNTGDLRF